MSRLHFRVGHTDEAHQLVMKFHYSRRMPSNIQFVGTWHRDGGLFGDFGDAVAAIIFSIPPTRWAEDVWELSRLVRDESVSISLTGLISAACRELNRTKEMDLLVSFADNTQGHHGGIYQAASWNFHGLRDGANDGCTINGTFIPGRSLNSKYGTRSPTKLAERLKEQTVEAHYDLGKYLYWKPLNKAGMAKATRLNLMAAKYPKPQVAA